MAKRHKFLQKTVEVPKTFNFICKSGVLQISRKINNERYAAKSTCLMREAASRVVIFAVRYIIYY